MAQELGPVELAIKAAREAASALESAKVGTQVATVSTQAGTEVAVAAPAKGAPLTMEALLTGSINVDNWFKPKEFGLLIGDKPNLFKTARVALDMTSGLGFVPKRGIKGGNPAQYFYTTDGVTSVMGGSWDAAQAKCRALDPKASEYRCVDLPFVLLDPVVADGVTLAEAGQRIGYTTSTTNWKAWEAFYNECKVKDLLGKRVELVVGAERRTNKNNNVWGTMTFALVGELVAEEVE